jgi:hypothetical protein
MAMDGTPISATDVARMEADEELHADWQRKAIRVVAGSSHSADDCRLLLAILGLDVAVMAEDRRSAADPSGGDPAPEPVAGAEPVSESGSGAKPARTRRTEAA